MQKPELSPTFMHLSLGPCTKRGACYENTPSVSPCGVPDLYDDNDVGDVVTVLTGSPEFEY